MLLAGAADVTKRPRSMDAFDPCHGAVTWLRANKYFGCTVSLMLTSPGFGWGFFFPDEGPLLIGIKATSPPPG